jgi:hypothetical protein
VCTSAVPRELVEDGIEEVDRHEHVALHLLVLHGLLHEQRPDADELAVAVEQCRAAPLRMRGRREERLVEHVLPVAREFASRNEPRLERMRAAAMADHVDLAADRGRRAATARQRGCVERAERQHQAEPGDLVIRERMRGHGDARAVREPYAARFGDEVADRQHEPVGADHDAVADALGAEDARGESLVRNLRVHQHDRIQRAPEIEANVVGCGLEFGRECPVRELGHAGRMRGRIRAVAYVTADPRRRAASAFVHFSKFPILSG